MTFQLNRPAVGGLGDFPYLKPEMVDKHLDAILKASGSALKNYSTPKTLGDMRTAMRAAMFEAIEESIK
jgi:hypothetical protein